MIVQCCDCKKILGEKPPFGDKRVTHGYCEPCAAKVREQIEAYKRSRQRRDNPRPRGYSYTQRLHRMGFDLSRYVPEHKAWKIGCSQCQALVINGVPTHESGCPNAPRLDRKPRRLPRRDNPGLGSVVGEIPGRIEEIRYQRFGPQVSKKMRGPYRHKFTAPGTKMLAMSSGAVVIMNPRRKLWLKNSAD